jgi:hypothetical protein
LPGLSYLFFFVLWYVTAIVQSNSVVIS